MLELFAGHECLTIYHDHLFANPQETMAQAFAFLGEAPVTVKVKNRKLNRIAHREGITNHREVAAFFQRSLFEEYFDPISSARSPPPHRARLRASCCASL